MKFSHEMVHILPGYPMQSKDDPGIAIVAFYVHLPDGAARGAVVRGDVLKDIVENEKDKIGESMDSTVVSAQPLPSTTETLEDTNKDKDNGNEGKSGPTNVITGASIGGGVLFVIIAALLLGWKKSNRYLKNS